ncbi:Protein DEEPER ROOTING 1 [Heracleum sosnowskyi]|uniref:Protein DEEPER ROOTING 1 n=1 Tax=Heracleum sosnowskyi TaxID=360622 RepID=A0AAD8GVS2_9APIA|nr:Protein DEEPER ROOTING 1 [Heracleum sosnowskyi]
MELLLTNLVSVNLSRQGWFQKYGCRDGSIFSWMQSKASAKQRSKSLNSVAPNKRVLQEPLKEEFSDWPHGLLAIGTFGNNNARGEIENRNLQLTEASSQDHLQDLTPEEVEELQNELELELGEPEVECNSLAEQDTSRENNTSVSNILQKGIQLQRCSSAVLSRGKDSQLDSSSNGIGKKSMSFLFKKMLLCSGGFSPTPSLRDPFTEQTHVESRMKKILTTILSKKIYPQCSSPKANTPKKYLENKQFFMTDSDSEDDMSNDGSKWVKTDSEFIVLEI